MPCPEYQISLIGTCCYTTVNCQNLPTDHHCNYFCLEMKDLIGRVIFFFLYISHSLSCLSFPHSPGLCIFYWWGIWRLNLYLFTAVIARSKRKQQIAGGKNNKKKENEKMWSWVREERMGWENTRTVILATNLIGFLFSSKCKKEKKKKKQPQSRGSHFFCIQHLGVLVGLPLKFKTHFHCVSMTLQCTNVSGSEQ